MQTCKQKQLFQDAVNCIIFMYFKKDTVCIKGGIQVQNAF